jgi:sugar phosphate isomerase/epimerase
VNLPLYAMDVGFYSTIGTYSLQSRCEMLAELGYWATDLTLWSEPAWHDLPNLAATARATGIAVACVNATVDIGLPLSAPDTVRVLNMIAAADDLPRVEIALLASGFSASNPSGDPLARRFLDAALHAAHHSGTQLLLYPHYGYWLQGGDDAIRLCSRYGDPAVGLTFSSFHWYANGVGRLREAIAAATPFLRLVNTCGSRRAADGYFPASIEPVPAGEFDNFAFLGMLRHVGYSGPIGVQGYGIGGDAYANFRLSRDAIRDIEERLDRAPRWAQLRADHL